jgi:ABC-type multidrug transport system ATPase subunit
VELLTNGVRRLGPLSVTLSSGITALTGPSGSGKTSLINLLAGYEQPTTGRILRTIPPVPDKPVRIPLFWAPAGDGLWPHLTVDQHLRQVGLSDPSELLDVFALTPLAARRPEALSRGERNRLAVARVVASAALVWLLDEPLAHLPRPQAMEIWPWLLARARATGASVLYASHSPELADLAERQVKLLDGRLVTP